uniref:Uncharacterized protein n=1 Tax=Amphimedon queenslandica TaxID=400682 RepID=A0A1X7TLG9_AMPQE
MSSNGFRNKSWKQCRTKIKGLGTRYRVSGTDRKDYPFYKDLDPILGTRAATEPPLLIESSEPITIAPCEDDTDDEVGIDAAVCSPELLSGNQEESVEWPNTTVAEQPEETASGLPKGNGAHKR